MAVRKRILAIIRHDDCQLLHCHGARANMIGALVQRQARIPVISTIHSDYRLDYLGRPLARADLRQHQQGRAAPL